MLLHQLFEEKPVVSLPTFELVSRAEADGGRVGETFPITYAELNAIFGKAKNINGDKTSTQWTIRFSNGVVAAIYDYKETSVYSKSLPSPEKFRKSGPHMWSIGGSMQDIIGKTNINKVVTLVYATIFKHWSDDQIMKLALKVLKNPDGYLMPGTENKPVKSILAAARMAGKDLPEFAAIEKSLGSPKHDK